VYFDQSRKEVLQRARVVVLCANGVESAKLLLLSACKQFPDGLANSSGLVGKYLMWDLGLLAEGLFEHPSNEYKSVQVTRLIHDFYECDPKRGFYGGGAIDARFDFYPAGFALAGLPPDAPRWGLEFKKTFGYYFTRTISLLSHTTSLPMESNTVSLDPTVRDAWGLPAVRITYAQHPDDVATLKWMMQRQHEILEAMGAKKIWGDPIDTFYPSRHLIGTCRMGKDPAKAVVNSYGRAHDVPNLFIVDGSNLVTSARQQPTATIQALAYRAADNMIALAKTGEL
jgi:choline dehydrogenase-like flavoprotein